MALDNNNKFGLNLHFHHHNWRFDRPLMLPCSISQQLKFMKKLDIHPGHTEDYTVQERNVFDYFLDRPF
jgi:hypothetical protein